MPNFLAKCLITSKIDNTCTSVGNAKVTLYCVYSYVLGKEMIDSYSLPFSNTMGTTPDCQVLELNIQPRLLNYTMVSLFSGNLKRQVAPERQNTYFLSNVQIKPDVMRQLGMLNQHIS